MSIIDRQTSNLIFDLEKRVERLERESRRREEDPLAYAEEMARNERIKKANENLDRQRGCYIAPKSPTNIENNEIGQTVSGKVYVRLQPGPAVVFDLKTAKLISTNLTRVIDSIEGLNVTHD